MRPFCESGPAAMAFDSWVKRLEALGVELAETDLFVVGLVASRQTNLEALRARLAEAEAPAALLAEERAAAKAFAEALDRAERVLGARAGEVAEALPVAVGGGRVLRLVAHEDAAPRNRGRVVVAERILVALGAGRALTRDELRAKVRGSKGEFLAQLKVLVRQGRVVAEGAGVKGSPRRYSIGGAR